MSTADAFPDAIRKIEITIASPGMSAETVEKEIAVPIERALAKLENARNIQSTSSHGFCSLEVSFVGISEADAAARVRQALKASDPPYPDAKVQVQVQART